MFSIEMLRANEGDALWIEYGEDPVRRILIDCGRKTAYRDVAARLGEDPSIRFELLVLTHVDADHISGAIPLLQDARLTKERVGDVWFNGWRHLNGLHRDFDGDIPVLGAKQGEYFGAVLRKLEYPWNDTFEGLPAVVEDEGPLPEIALAGGMVLTLLGPTRDKLEDMRKRWKRDLRALPEGKELDPGDFERAFELLADDAQYGPDLLRSEEERGPIVVDDLLQQDFDPDGSEPNGSSISFLAEHDGKAVLFAADAHAPQLEASVRRLLAARGLERLKLDALKMAHHGSARNNSTALLELIDARRYLISTNGSGHQHPDPAALARVLGLHESGVEFYFNYESEETLPWGDEALKSRHGYDAIYPQAGASLKVEL